MDFESTALTARPQMRSMSHKCGTPALYSLCTRTETDSLQPQACRSPPLPHLMHMYPPKHPLTHTYNIIANREKTVNILSYRYDTSNRKTSAAQDLSSLARIFPHHPICPYRELCFTVRKHTRIKNPQGVYLLYLRKLPPANDSEVPTVTVTIKHPQRGWRQQETSRPRCRARRVQFI